MTTTKDSWLPEGFEIPNKDTGYVRYEQGPNKFRILSKPVLGYEAWIDAQYTENKKPKPERYRMGEQMTQKKEWSQNPKHFWAFVVWNYRIKKIQILNVTQITIQRALEDLYRNEDWGEPFGYDITITKTGQGLEATYGVQPSPHKPLDPEIKKAYEALTINLDALFSSEDPFANITGNHDL